MSVDGFADDQIAIAESTLLADADVDLASLALFIALALPSVRAGGLPRSVRGNDESDDRHGHRSWVDLRRWRLRNDEQQLDHVAVSLTM